MARLWQIVLKGGLIGLLAHFVCIAGAANAQPEPQREEPRPLTEAERKSIQEMSVPRLEKLIKEGISWERIEAVKSLANRGQGRLLLRIAKEGDRETNEIVIGFFSPRATDGSALADKQLVDDYLAFLEGELRSKDAVVNDEDAVEGIAHVASYYAWELPQDPSHPNPQPRYAHHRVVQDLIGLLNDERPLVRDEAILRLGPLAGYSTADGRDAIAALEKYKAGLSAVLKNPQELQRKEIWVDASIRACKNQMQLHSEDNLPSPIKAPEKTSSETIPPRPPPEGVAAGSGSGLQTNGWIPIGIGSLFVLAIGVWLIVRSCRKSPKQPTTQA